MFKKNETPDYEYFSIYDTKVGSYREPMLAINRHDMIRQIHSLFRDPAQAANVLITNAEDFAVFKVGEYTKKSGTIQGTQHEHIANLHDIRAMVQKDQNQPLGLF